MRARFAISAVSCLAACGFESRTPRSNDANGTGGEPIATDALLQSIEVWAAPSVPIDAALAPAFDPQVTSYGVGVRLLRQRVLVSAVPVDSTTTITIAGAPVAAGALSMPIALALGSNPVAVVATASDGTQRTYTVDVTRAATLAHHAYVKASNTGAGDRFGYAVAASRDTIAIGAPLEDSDATGIDGDGTNNNAPDAGAVYVFVRAGATWTQQAYLKASNTGATDQFGFAVALHGDTLAVGAFNEDSNAIGVGGSQTNNSASDSGAVYMFTRSGSTWSQQAYIKASNPAVDDSFGSWVELAEDLLVVGAPFEDSNATGINGSQGNNSATDSGAVYVFARTGTTWSQEAYIKATNTQAQDHFGFNFALAGDTLAVSAEHEDSAATGVGGDQADNSAVDSGAVYVYRRTGTTWAHEAYLKASNTSAGDGFGDDVSLVGADLLLTTSRFEDSVATDVGGNQASNAAMDSGAGYVFARAGTTWSQQAYLKASNTGAGDEFGLGIATSGDIAFVTAPREDGASTGFGGDQTSNGASSSGAMYVFHRSVPGWIAVGYVKAANTGAGDELGFASDVAGETVVVSSMYEDSNAVGIGGSQSDNSAIDSGAIYLLW